MTHKTLLSLLLGGGLALAGAARAQDAQPQASKPADQEKSEKKQAESKDSGLADVKIRVVRATSGKPVRNASVILHQVSGQGKQKKGGLQLKTDPEGNAAVPAMPCGKWRVQVIAPGFQTFGEDFEFNPPEFAVVIKLEKPKEQVTIYDKK